MVISRLKQESPPQLPDTSRLGWPPFCYSLIQKLQYRYFMLIMCNPLWQFDQNVYSGWLWNIMNIKHLESVGLAETIAVLTSNKPQDRIAAVCPILELLCDLNYYWLICSDELARQMTALIQKQPYLRLLYYYTLLYTHTRYKIM